MFLYNRLDVALYGLDQRVKIAEKSLSSNKTSHFELELGSVKLDSFKVVHEVRFYSFLCVVIDGVPAD